MPGMPWRQIRCQHKSKEPDCRVCHVPATSTSDIAHTQATDHRILRKPQTTVLNAQAPTEQRLLPFPVDSAEPDARHLGFAWESLAQQGVKGADAQADQWLHKAVLEGPNDAGVLAALGYEEQKRGLTEQAREHYLRALGIDPC